MDAFTYVDWRLQRNAERFHSLGRNLIKRLTKYELYGPGPIGVQFSVIRAVEDGQR